MATFLLQLFNALALASVYVLVALGITLIYGLTRLVYFAQGQMLTLGAFIALVLVTLHVPFWLAVLLAMAAVGLVGEALDLGVFRNTLTKPLSGFIVSLALISIFEAVFILRWGTNVYTLDAPLRGSLQLGIIRIDEPRLLVIAIATLICGLLFLVLERTDIGRATRALAEDGMAARTLGVPVGMLISITFFIGSAIAALGGVLAGTIYSFSAFSGSDFLLEGFAIAIIGGLGNVRGAVVASLILATAETLGAGYASVAWSVAFGLAAMTLILAIRPTGLFAGTESASEEGFGGNWAAATASAGAAAKQQAGRLGRFGRAWGAAMAGVLFLVLLPAVLPSQRSLVIATAAMVTAIIAFNLWLTYHYTGILSIVQAALMGVGAYTAGILTNDLGFSFWIQVVAAAIFGSAVATAMGLISLRTTATAFVILTFALSQLVVTVLTNWTSLTKGPIGIVVSRPVESLGPIDFSDSLSFYYLVIGLLALVVAVAVGIRFTAFGGRLMTIRDNERLARSLGLNTYVHKLALFGGAGAVAGIGGCLFMHQQRYIDPTLFSAFTAINIQLIVVLGGIRSPLGPVVGALFISFLPEVLHLDPIWTELMYGVLLAAVILVMPQGLTGLLYSIGDRLPALGSGRAR
jgi:branched-chain amino acid transport system permease protein